MVAVPAEGCTRPSSMRRVVVLPEPLGPRKPVTRPGSTVNDRSSTARTGPKDLESPRISIGSPRVVAPAVIGATLARAHDLIQSTAWGGNVQVRPALIVRR